MYRLGMMYWMSAWSASFVIPLRLMRISAGGPEAATEMVRMITEKQAALMEGAFRAGLAMARGASAIAVASAAYRPARRQVDANLRRLRGP